MSRRSDIIRTESMATAPASPRQLNATGGAPSAWCWKYEVVWDVDDDALRYEASLSVTGLSGFLVMGDVEVYNTNVTPYALDLSLTWGFPGEQYSGSALFRETMPPGANFVRGTQCLVVATEEVTAFLQMPEAVVGQRVDVVLSLIVVDVTLQTNPCCKIEQDG